MDGMADYPVKELGDKTPMQVAKKPNIDELFKKSKFGLVNNVPENLSPGSDVANLSAMGYDPQKFYTGRSPLEAVSMGIDLKESDIVFRCNVVTVTEDEENYEDKIIIDHSADEITTEEARILIEDVQKHFGNSYLSFYPGVSYRHALVWDKGPESYDLTPPHDILEKKVGDYLPKGESVVLTEGQNGTYLCVGTATYINGILANRTAESTTVQTEPVKALVAVGIGTGKAKQGVPIVGQNKLLTWEGEVLEFTHKDEFKATCYYRFPVDGEITAMGTPTRVGAIAVDPKVIPYWTRMYIVTQDGEYIYGVAVAEDCGTAIKGKWVDLFYETYEEACKFGRRQVDIYFLA